MICPSKLCKCEIPDDSLYCDQCGIKILKCPKCGTVGISKYCGKCGTPLIFAGDINSGNSEQPKVGESSGGQNVQPAVSKPVEHGQPVVEHDVQPQSVVEPVASGTQIINFAASKPKELQIFHSEGWSINPANGDILGRAMGPFVSYLGRFPVISSRHAQISFNNDNWYITDLNSTNKTYLNDMQLAPNVPAQLSDKDVLVLANVSFMVRVI